MKLNNDVPTLLYGSETRVLNQKDYSSLTAAEMVYLRSVKGCKDWTAFTTKVLDKNLT
jgi:hypothetical protein